MAQRHFNYSPYLKAYPSALVRIITERSSVTSVSVALHESNLSLRADTLVLHRVSLQHEKVMRHREPDE